MATAIQRRRGTSTQHGSFTGLAGEITIDTTNNTVVVHDGSTAGGHRLAKYAEITALGEGDITGIVAGAGLTGDATSGDATLAVGAGTGITVNANDIELDNSVVRGLFSASGDLTYNSGTGAFSFTNDAGDIEGVTAGSGITGGGTTGTVTVAVNHEAFSGNLIPSSNNTFQLGSATHVWKDVFVGPGSLYVNGQQVLSDNSGTIQVSADTNQNISVLTTGSGDVELTAGGSIQLKSDVVLSAGKTISQVGGLVQASNINMNSNSINNLDDPVVAQDAATKTYVDTTVAASGDILGVTAGDGLSGGGTTGTVSLALDLNELTAAAVDVTADSIALIDGSDNSSKKESITDLVSAIAGTGITATSGVLSLTDTGYVTGVTAGDGLSGGGTEGTVAIALDLNELTSAAVDVSADSIVMVDGTDNSSKKETIADLATAMAGTNITASSGQLVGTAGTVTSVGGGAGLTGTVTSSGSLAVGQGSGITVNADDVAVDSTVVRTTGTQSIGGDKTFEEIIISGNLTVNGTTTQVNTETLTVDDNIIVLNNNESGTPSEDAGIEIERGTSTNVKLQWDESADVWQFTNDGSTYYSVPTTANIRTAMGVSDAGGLGSFTYTSGTGVYEYTGPSNADITGLISVTDAGGLGSLAYSSGEITYTGPADADITGLISVTDAGGDGSLSYNAGVITYTGPSAAETRAHLSAVTSGDGSLSYSSSTGAFTYTGPSASETRAHFSGGTSITLSSGEISVTAGSIGATQLAATAVTSGTYGDADSVAQFTVDADGRITSASNIDISIVAGDVSGLAASATTDTTSASNISSGTLASARLPELAVSDFAGAAVQTSGESFANNDTSFMTSASIEDKILSYGYSTTTGDILGVTAGTGLSGGGTSGTVTLNVGGLTVSELAAGSLQISSESFADNDTTLMTSAAIQDKILSYGYTTTTGDITGVTASTGLSGGGSSGAVSLSVDLGDTGTFTSTNTASKAVVRDGSGNFAAGTITATATQAQYADLAEKYESDAEYEPGTVVVFGGDKEITACSSQGSHAVVGVISTDPAYMMNSEAEGQYVALTGRVPCKVTGPVAKGDLLVSSGEEGHAEVQNEARPGTIIGKAIGTNPEGNGPAIIEVLVSLM